MAQYLYAVIPEVDTIKIELDDSFSPNTMKALLQSLPFSVTINTWGEEIYTDEIPVSVDEENSKAVVSVNDFAYWPPGRALCLFYGPTPISDSNTIKPYSPVNVIGRILSPDKSVLRRISSGLQATFTVK